MKAWELTNDELASFQSGEYALWGDFKRAIAKAAQRKLVDWMREPCHKHNAGMLRLGCAECWRNMRKGIYDE